jgi:hypothetical protein
MLFYRWDLDCRLMETSSFTNFILPPADKMVVVVTDPLNYHIDTPRGKTTLQALFSLLTST